MGIVPANTPRSPFSALAKSQAAAAVQDVAAEAQSGRKVLVLPLAPSLEQRRLQLYIAQVLIDGLCLFSAFTAMGYLYLGSGFDPMIVRQIVLVVPLYWTAALSLRTYSTRALLYLRHAQFRAIVALLTAVMTTLFMLFLSRGSSTFSRVTLMLGITGAAILLSIVRVWTHNLFRGFVGPRGENILVLDDGGDAVRLPHAYHINCREHRLVPDLADPHMLNRIGLFMANMDSVLVTCPPERRMDWALVFKGANVQGEIIDRTVMEMGVLGTRQHHSHGSLLVSSGPLGLRARITKRLFDMTVSGLAMLALSPLLLVVALLIKLEDGGPVFFIQQRTGLNNRFFPIFKFRSMRAGQLDARGNRSASKDDDRITRIGRFIRRTSIDELPQLFNVFRSDMSLVGPRPHAIGSLAGEKKFWEVDRRYWTRHALKPGLTGLAQIRGAARSDRLGIGPVRKTAVRSRIYKRLDHLARPEDHYRDRRGHCARPRVLTPGRSILAAS